MADHQKLEYQSPGAKRENKVFTYIGRTILVIFVLLFAGVAFAVLYAAVYFFSGGGYMP